MRQSDSRRCARCKGSGWALGVLELVGVSKVFHEGMLLYDFYVDSKLDTRRYRGVAVACPNCNRTGRIQDERPDTDTANAS